jgi:hypothetical protein
MNLGGSKGIYALEKIVAEETALAAGLPFMLPGMPLAPQETRTYLVTAVTAQRAGDFFR